jgi:predicted amidohydrolase
MKVALIQMNSGCDKEKNFELALDCSRLAAKKGADIVCLPELFLYWGNSMEKEVETISSSYIETFKILAREESVNIILGSISLEKEGFAVPANSTLVVNRKGKIVFRYDKIYMFEVQREDLTLKESDFTIAGSKLGLFELEGVKMGVGICYDLRYPEYFQELALQGAEVIFLPANFRKITGEVAWDILTKARAIENQVYFCACGQAGGEGLRERCGRSRTISFEGRIVSEARKEEEVLLADLDLLRLRKFRKEFPVLRQVNKWKN